MHSSGKADMNTARQSKAPVLDGRTDTSARAAVQPVVQDVICNQANVNEDKQPRPVSLWGDVSQQHKPTLHCVA